MSAPAKQKAQEGRRKVPFWIPGILLSGDPTREPPCPWSTHVCRLKARQTSAIYRQSQLTSLVPNGM